ncbi:hypothetical protein TNCV_3126751 [Trichonephila clavipes]|nr:hypothetical protein TNCV_3126751 [Trichonephila clavipes]
MADVKKILNIMTMFGKPSSSLDSIIHFNKPREPDLMSSFLQPGSFAATKAYRRTRSMLAAAPFCMPPGAMAPSAPPRYAAGWNTLLSKYPSHTNVKTLTTDLTNIRPSTQRVFSGTRTQLTILQSHL